MTRLLSRNLVGWLCGICMPLLTACVGSGITPIDSTKISQTSAKDTGGAVTQTPNDLSDERKAIAAQIVDEVQNFNVMMLGRRQITDAKIYGPVADEGWLKDSKNNVYCVRFLVKAERLEYLSGELRYVAIVHRSNDYISAKIKRSQASCVSEKTPFLELNQLASMSGS